MGGKFTKPVQKKSKHFSQDMPMLKNASGKVIAITGCTAGMGRVSTFFKKIKNNFIVKSFSRKKVKCECVKCGVSSVFVQIRSSRQCNYVDPFIFII